MYELSLPPNVQNGITAPKPSWDCDIPQGDPEHWEGSNCHGPKPYQSSVLTSLCDCGTVIQLMPWICLNNFGT